MSTRSLKICEHGAYMELFLRRKSRRLVCETCECNRNPKLLVELNDGSLVVLIRPENVVQLALLNKNRSNELFNQVKNDYLHINRETRNKKSSDFLVGVCACHMCIG